MNPSTGIAVATAAGAFVLAVRLYKAHKIWFLICSVGFVFSVVAIVHFQNEQEYEEHGNDAVFVGRLVPAARRSRISVGP